MSSTGDSSADSKAEGSKGIIHSVLSKAWEESTLFRRPKEIVTSFRTEGYHYTALPHQSCIRLLNIKPGKPQDMIEVDLRTVDLTERPKYTALSYSWQRDRRLTPTAMQALGDGMQMGKAFTWDKLRVGLGWREDQQDEESQKSSKPNEGTRYILCNGKYLAIWPNLYQAMLQLRRSRPGDFWIDAVCINQDDQEEKGHQIQMMGRIYESAEMVTVWLGTCPTIFDSGMKDLLARKLQQKEWAHVYMFFSALWLLTRRWFRRLWVLQEACLAKEILFFFGEHEIDAHTLVTTIEWFTDPENIGMFVASANTLLPPWGTHIRYVPAILDSREEFKQGGKWPLIRWLEATRGRKTTKVNDFVFAGLGLIQPETLRIDTTLQLEEEGTPPPLPQRPGNPQPNLGASMETVDAPPRARKLWSEIRADVEAESAEIFLNVTACLLSQPDGIDLLLSTAQRLYKVDANDIRNALQRSKPAIAELPSWCCNPTSFASRKVEPMISVGLGKPIYSACTQRVSNAKISADGTLLHLDVILVDRIKMRWESATRPEDVLETLLDLPARYETTGEDSLTVVARTLIAGLWNDTYPPPAEALNALRVWLCKGGRHGNREPKGTEKAGLQSSTQQLQQLEEVVNKPMDQESKSSELNSEQILKSGEPAQPSGNEDGKKNEEDIDKHEEWYQAVVEKFPHHQWPKFDDPVTEEDTALAARYFKILVRMMLWRAVFVTERGMLGMGSTWVKKGDAIMLVKGASLPHIFTHAGRNLERRISARKKDLEDLEMRVRRKMRLERQLRELEAKKAKKDAWRLVGEAYVDGVMMGEAAVPSEFQRIDVL